MGIMKKIVVIILALLIVGLVLMAMLSSFVTDLWWFNNLGFAKVFWTSYQTQYFFWFLGFLVSMIVLNANAAIALHGSNGRKDKDAEPSGMSPGIELVRRNMRLIARAGTVLISIFMAGFLSASWNQFLLFLNSEKFNLADPVFGHDVGFYVFTLPFLDTVRTWLLGLFFLSLVVTVLLFGLQQLQQKIGLVAESLLSSKTFRRQSAVLSGLILGLVALGYYFDRFEVLYSTRSGSFYGPGYTDVNATIPLCWVMVALTLFLAVAGIVRILSNRNNALLKTAVIGFAVGLVVSFVYPRSSRNSS
jgi:uncharacterized protein